MSFPSILLDAALSLAELVQTATDPVGQLLGQNIAEDDTSFVRGWERFTEGSLLLLLIFDTALTLVLASTIAFHPRRRGRAITPDELEYPKTVLLYAVVGAIVAEIVVVSPAMALVVFGIGGLLRFRTEIGSAHDTGHVILATLIGITCGLSRYPLAVVATAVGWTLIWLLEGKVHYRLVVEKVDRRTIESAIDLYQTLLEQEGWSIHGVKRDPGKERFTIYVRGKDELSHVPMEDRLPDAPAGMKGRPYWEEI